MIIFLFFTPNSWATGASKDENILFYDHTMKNQQNGWATDNNYEELYFADAGIQGKKSRCIFWTIIHEVF